MTNEDFIGKMMAAVSRMEASGRRMEGELAGLRQTVSSLQSTVATQSSQLSTLNGTNQTLATEVMQLRAFVARIPCSGSSQEHDTNPECLQSFRPKLCSVSEDEPDSALMREMELRASKSGFVAKGPSVMVIAFGALVVVVAGAWAWVKSLPHGVIEIH